MELGLILLRCVESNVWARIPTTGVDLPPLRAHTTTLVGKKLYIIAGGDGNVYNNDVWVLDTGKLLDSDFRALS